MLQKFTRRRLATLATSLTLLAALMGQGFAMGGGGSDKDPPQDNVRRIKLSPVDEKSTAYGWVRITADSLSLGANRLQPDSYYTVYFVNGADKQAVGEEPTIQATGAGEAKFSIRLTEPLGAKWAKIVLYRHGDDKPAIVDGNLKPWMEGSLR